MFSGDYLIDNKKNEFYNNHSDLFIYSLVDDILISNCFENYFKAKLLLKGFIIHEIKKEKNPELYKKQAKEPILASELNFKSDYTSEELSEKTINFSLLLKNKKYKMHFDICDEIICVLKKITEKRNSLHFQMNSYLTLSKSEINNLEKLITLVNNDFIELNNSLRNKMEKITGKIS